MAGRGGRGAVYGTAGGGLSNASWAANADVARIGQDGEVRTAELLDDLAHRQGGPTVLHDLRVPIPGFKANVDHVIVAGKDVHVIDSKVWKPGFYWTVGGVTRRGWDRFPPADKRTMVAAFDSFTHFLVKRAPGAVIHRPVLVVWPSNSRSVLRTWFLSVPGADVVNAARLPAMLRSRSLLRAGDPAVVNALRTLVN